MVNALSFSESLFHIAGLVWVIAGFIGWLGFLHHLLAKKREGSVRNVLSISLGLAFSVISLPVLVVSGPFSFLVPAFFGDYAVVNMEDKEEETQG